MCIRVYPCLSVAKRLLLFLAALAVYGMAALACGIDAAGGGLQGCEVLRVSGFLDGGTGRGERVGVFHPGILIFRAAAGFQQLRGFL